MAVTAACPACSSTVTVSDDLVGKRIRCKQCREAFAVTPVKAQAASGRSDRASGNAPAARPKARAEGSGGAGKALLIGAITAGVALLITAGVVAALMMSKTDETAGKSAAGTPLTPAVAVPAVAKAEPVKPADPPAAAAPAKAEKPAETPVVAKRTGPAKFVPNPLRMPYLIQQATIERVKASAAWIKVVHPGGGGFGSGWFAEPGIVITNSHVVGMKEPAQAPPTSIKIVLNAGEVNKEREFDGTLLGLDRENDLAVIRITGDNLPEPMPIARSSELNESQKLWVIGFPFGNQLATGFSDDRTRVVTTVKSRETTVSGRSQLTSGGIKYIRIEGGADPGNSGGMIVDAAGNVRCVLVAGAPGTGLVFSIPTEYVIFLLQGRVLKLIPAQPYEQDGKVRQELTALVADPLQRIRSVSIDLWTAPPGRKVRPASDTQPAPIPGEGPRQTIRMDYDPEAKVPLGEARRATGVGELPPLKDGEAYWVQASYERTDGSHTWGEAIALETAGLPVVRKPAKLAVKFEAGTQREVDLVSNIAVGGSPEGGELHLQPTGVVMKIAEKVQKVNKDGSAKIDLSYKDFRLAEQDADRDMRRMNRGVLEAVQGMVTEFTLTPRGIIREPKSKLDKVPVPLRPFVSKFTNQTVQSLEALSLALPEKEVQPGETWTHDVNYTVTLDPQVSENALFHHKYRYMGVREREGRQEAVIEFEGEIVRVDGPPPSASDLQPKAKGERGPLHTRGMHGKSRGAALVDLQTGAVTLGHSEANTEFEASLGGKTIKFGASLRIDLYRPVTAAKTKPSAARLLPNWEVTFTPFVGSPDVSLTSAP